MKKSNRELVYLKGCAGVLFFALASLAPARDMPRDTDLVQGIDIECLLHRWNVSVGENGVDVMQQGLRFWLFDRDGNRAGRLVAGVFGDVARAEKLFRSRIWWSSQVGPVFGNGSDASDMYGEMTEGARQMGCHAGDIAAVWRTGKNQALSRICFRTRNVLVDLMDAPEETLLRRAEDLDGLLRAGGECVRLGAEVDVPVLEESRCRNRSWGLVEKFEDGYAALLDWRGVACGLSGAAEACFARFDCVMADPVPWNPAWQKSAPTPSSSPEASETRKNAQKQAIAILADATTAPCERNKAVLALGNSGDVSVIPLLLGELEKTDNFVVKQNAIRALGMLRATVGVPRLIQLLEAPVVGNLEDEGELEAIFRREAVSALKEIGDPRALDVLQKIAGAEHEYESVRQLAQVASRSLQESLKVVP